MLNSALKGSAEHLFDVAIIGAGFAGLSAALPLARARRSVVVFDTHEGRNRFANHSHGFIGHDGKSPSAIKQSGIADVLKYRTVEHKSERVIFVAGEREAFEIRTEQGVTYAARRVILAFGMVDELPNIDGLAACWGKTINQCPYCHGYELADVPTAVLMTGPATSHQAKLVTDWSEDVTLLTNGFELSSSDRHELLARRLKVQDGKLASILHTDGEIRAVIMADGVQVPLKALYLITKSHMSCELAEKLGCKSEDGPFGPFITVDSLQETSVAGIYAAGDIARIGYNATWAAADGARAGVFCHQSLLIDHDP